MTISTATATATALPRFRVSLGMFSFDAHVQRDALGERAYLAPQRGEDGQLTTSIERRTEWEVDAHDEDHAQLQFCRAMGIRHTDKEFTITRVKRPTTAPNARPASDVEADAEPTGAVRGGTYSVEPRVGKKGR